MSITAIVLAGGQGSRMNHQDKAWVEHLGKPLIHHVIDRISSAVDTIIISRNQKHPSYDELPFLCVSDDYQAYQGPLAGIASCYPYISSDQTLVVPCDTPSLPSDLVPRLQSAMANNNLVVAIQGDRLQPLIFVAETQLLASIPAYLETERRSVRGWLETTEYTTAVFDDCPEAFENINKPQQLR